MPRLLGVTGYKIPQKNKSLLQDRYSSEEHVQVDIYVYVQENSISKHYKSLYSYN